jgi:hypothetical protein
MTAPPGWGGGRRAPRRRGAVLPPLPRHAHGPARGGRPRPATRRGRPTRGRAAVPPRSSRPLNKSGAWEDNRAALVGCPACLPARRLLRQPLRGSCGHPPPPAAVYMENPHRKTTRGRGMTARPPCRLLRRALRAPRPPLLLLGILALPAARAPAACLRPERRDPAAQGGGGRAAPGVQALPRAAGRGRGRLAWRPRRRAPPGAEPPESHSALVRHHTISNVMVYPPRPHTDPAAPDRGLRAARDGARAALRPAACEPLQLTLPTDTSN